MVFHRVNLMVKCWNFDPEDRPTFKELCSSTSAYVEKIAGYLDMNFNPFSEDQQEEPAIPPCKDENEDVQVEQEPTIQMFPPSLNKTSSVFL